MCHNKVLPMNYKSSVVISEGRGPLIPNVNRLEYWIYFSHQFHIVTTHLEMRKSNRSSKQTKQIPGLSQKPEMETNTVFAFPVKRKNKLCS